MERCPACRARLEGQVICPRCGCELSLAWRAEAQADAQCRLAIDALQAGAHPQALRYFRKAGRLNASPLHKALARWLE